MEWMSGKAFDKNMRGLEAAKAYLEREQEGHKLSVPPTNADIAPLRRKA